MNVLGKIQEEEGEEVELLLILWLAIFTADWWSHGPLFRSILFSSRLSSLGDVCWGFDPGK